MTNKELLECIAAEEAGKKIECRRSDLNHAEWEPKDHTGWNTVILEYRIAPEPVKREGRWVRKEIVKKTGIATEYICGMLPIDALPRIPGFGGIEYVDPRNPDNTIVSTTPRLFDENGDTTWAVDKGLDLDHFRPGVPVAAWFWEEE